MGALGQCALVVDGLSLGITPEDLRELFESYGVVLAVHLASAPLGGSLGFGYVVMATEDEALKAIAALHGRSFGGRALRILPREVPDGLLCRLTTG